MRQRGISNARRSLVGAGARGTVRVAAAALAALAVVALTAGCTATTSPSTSGDASPAAGQDEGTPVDGGAMVIAVPAETPGWNPHDDQWPGWSAMVATSMMEPLATVDRDMNPVPWLAESWTPNATYDSYTIGLRAGVTFHNGEPFDADAVKLNLDDALTAPLSSVTAKALFEEITVVDPLTVRVDLTRPWAAFPNTFLAGTTQVMMAPAMLRSPDRGREHPIGTGPFVFSSWEKDDRLTTAKNPAYWREGLPHLDALDFSVLADPLSQTAALQAGDVDLVLSGSFEVSALASEGFTVVKDWTASPGLALTNTAPDIAGEPNPMADLHARRALALATDQHALADAVGEGVPIPRSPIPSTSKWGMPDDQAGYPSFDLEAAKEEVERYKESSGASSLAIELSSLADTDTLRVAQALQAQWLEAGVEVAIEAKEAGAFIADVVVGSYQVALFGMYGAADPDFNYYFWSADNIHPYGEISLNFSRFTTPTMEAALEVGRSSPDFATRKRAYDDIVHEINANAVNIWTYYGPNSLVARAGVRGLRTPTEIPFYSSPPVWLADLWQQR